MNLRCIVCGKERGKYATSAGKCAECYRSTACSRNTLKIRPDDSTDYISQYRSFLNRMTSAQRRRFDQILSRRRMSALNRAEAVDVVMREPKPGICCKKCDQMRRVDRSLEDINRGLQSSWQMVVRYLESLQGDDANLFGQEN